mgnify:CR=1 FL=1
MCANHDDKTTDARLVRQLQAGETAAFEAIFERYRRPLLAYVIKRTGDRALAEDVVQESFVRLARHAARLNPRRSLSGWLFRVARNLAVDHARRRQREVLVDTAPAPKPTREAGPDAELRRRERRDAIERAMDALSERERDVLRLRFYGDLTFRDIAAATRRPLGTVLWQCRRALRKLREEMERTGADPSDWKEP